MKILKIEQSHDIGLCAFHSDWFILRRLAARKRRLFGEFEDCEVDFRHIPIGRPPNNLKRPILLESSFESKISLLKFHQAKIFHENVWAIQRQSVGVKPTQISYLLLFSLVQVNFNNSFDPLITKFHWERNKNIFLIQFVFSIGTCGDLHHMTHTLKSSNDLKLAPLVMNLTLKLECNDLRSRLTQQFLQQRAQQPNCHILSTELFLLLTMPSNLKF